MRDFKTNKLSTVHLCFDFCHRKKHVIESSTSKPALQIARKKDLIKHIRAAVMIEMSLRWIPEETILTRVQRHLGTEFYKQFDWTTSCTKNLVAEKNVHCLISKCTLQLESPHLLSASTKLSLKTTDTVSSLFVFLIEIRKQYVLYLVL